MVRPLFSGATAVELGWCHRDSASRWHLTGKPGWWWCVHGLRRGVGLVPSLRWSGGRGRSTTNRKDDALKLPDGGADPGPLFRLVRYRYQGLGAGDRLRVLDRLGIPRSEIRGLRPHEQIREVVNRVVASDLVAAFLDAADDVEGS